MTNRCTKKIHPASIALTIMLTFFLIPARSFGKEQVSGRYLQSSGTLIEVELNISSPAPPLVIVIQKLPKDTSVTGSSPTHVKYKPGKGVIKWLLRGVNAGKMRISLNLASSVKKGEVKGEIRWRDNSGKKVSRKISDD